MTITYNTYQNDEDNVSTDIAEPPYEFEPGTQKQMINDPKWNGIPPVGNKPTYKKWNFLILVLIVFIVKLIIWSIYRWITGIWEPLQNPVNNYTAGIFMKPILQLTPVFILWIYLFKEHGLPFRFTRKHLFSSIIFGCILGLLYYFVSSFVFIGVMGLSGQGTDFQFVAGWDDAGWWLITAMMFSFMIGTGPTEEIFSRGFIQDQTARAFPIWFAILFSSILFAIGHLPISVFVYHLSFMTIVWYMIVLVVMGGFFSILYQWSRNIVFPAIIHGLWDWYLSLFALRGAYSAEFMTDPDVNFGMMDFFGTLITISIMLPIFYLIYLVWWKHDKPLEHGPLANIVRAINNISITEKIRKLDLGYWPKANPILVTAALVGIFCLAMYPVAALIGTDDPSKQVDRIIGGESETIIVYDNDTITNSGTLNENMGTEIPINFNNKYIISISLSLTWSDEPNINALYTNEPDTFTLQLFDPDGRELGSEVGDSGNLEISWTNNNEIYILYNSNFTVIVELGDAGDQVGRFGVLRQADTSNDYLLTISYVCYSMIEITGDDADVRWSS